MRARGLDWLRVGAAGRGSPAAGRASAYAAGAVDAVVLAQRLGSGCARPGCPERPSVPRASRARSRSRRPPTATRSTGRRAVTSPRAARSSPAFDAVFAQVFDGVRDPADAPRGDPNAPPARPAGAAAPAAGAGRATQRPPAGRARPRHARGRRAERAAERPCSPPRARTSGWTTSASTRSTRKSWRPCAELMRRLGSPRRRARAAAGAPAAPASGSTCAPRCGRPAHRRRPAAPRRGAGAGSDRAGSWCCATSRGRWSPTRARSSSLLRARGAAAAPRRSCSPRGSPV